MKKLITPLLCIQLFLALSLFVQAEETPAFYQWATTPPMGWNSWDCYGADVTEAQVKANADYMAKHLKAFGWEYVVVDIRWFVSNQTTGTNYNQSNPNYSIDEYGRYMPAVNRFPSSANGQGFKPLADYVHDKGLKFGIHIMRGIPKKAVQDKLPILGTDGITANQIYSTALRCTWLQDNYTILANKPGAQEYYNSIFELYASWGVDFIKIDDLSRPYHQEEIELIRNAIDRTGRPIVLSTSPGATPIEKAEHVSTHANMWRMIDDLWDNWDQLSHLFEKCNQWSPYITPGAWPDCDMIPLGRISLKNDPRYTRLTKDEQYTLMTLFSIFRSPLMFGGNLPDNNAFTDSLLTNPDVLYVNQHSTNNRQLYNRDDVIAWTADDTGSDDKFLALFFTGDNGFIRTRDAFYRSGTISRLTDDYGVQIDIALPEGTDMLYLVVCDGGDGFTNDHADWINPIVYNEQGDTLELVSINWEMASTGWGTIGKNKSVSGGTLRIKDKTFQKGIGTHANSVIQYKIPEGFTRFASFAGLDRGGTDQDGGATMEFMLFNTDPTIRQVDPGQAVANSGRISRTTQREGVHLEADITGAQKLYLVVTDAGDNFNYDHADWINPTIWKEDGTGTPLTSLNWVSATSGWASVRKNLSLDGNKLTVNGQVYENGLGVNSYSYIVYNLPEGYTRFTAFCGFDDEVLNAPEGVTIEFMVFVDNDPRNHNVSRDVEVDLSELGFEEAVTITNLWKQKEEGIFEGTEFSTKINYHGAAFYRLSPGDQSFLKEVKDATQPYIIHDGDKRVIMNTQQGDKIMLYDLEGKLTDAYVASFNITPMPKKGNLLVHITRNGQTMVLKSLD